MGTQINMIGYFVDDIHHMVAFYRDVLGFEIDWDGKAGTVTKIEKAGS